MKIGTTLWFVAALGLMGYHDTTYGAPLESCTDQRNCIDIWISGDEPASLCTGEPCQKTVCLTLDTYRDGCIKDGANISHTCVADGSADPQSCNPLVKDSTNVGDQPDLLFLRSNGTQCQTVSAGSVATFVLKDGSDCDGTYDDGVTTCERRSATDVGKTCTGGGQNLDAECIWRVQTTPCGSAPDPEPTPGPTPAPAPGPGSVSGDPHFRTWTGTMYDFHGICDLVLLHNPGFGGGLGLDIHVRTSQLRQYSYVSSAALRIGDDILEVMGDNPENMLYWINKEGRRNAENKGIIDFVGGFPISYEVVNSKQHRFTVNLGDDKTITIMTFRKIVRVDISGATEDSFGASLGLLGSYGSGKMVARDKKTILEDVNAFGLEWQVLSSEVMLFHSVEGPQAPEKCFIPEASSLRRRLAESKISEEEAKMACARVNAEDFDMCVFDVMATGDEDMVGAY